MDEGAGVTRQGQEGGRRLPAPGSPRRKALRRGEGSSEMPLSVQMLRDKDPGAAQSPGGHRRERGLRALGSGLVQLQLSGEMGATVPTIQRRPPSAALGTQHCHFWPVLGPRGVAREKPVLRAPNRPRLGVTLAGSPAPGQPGSATTPQGPGRWMELDALMASAPASAGLGRREGSGRPSSQKPPSPSHRRRNRTSTGHSGTPRCLRYLCFKEPSVYIP